MGWSSANQIFNPVARALIDTGVPDETKRKVLGDLIGGLQDGDWDTEDESLEDFLDDPAIVSAFADHNVHLSDRRCCAREIGADVRQVIIGMRNDEDVSEQAITEALDAYAHQLAMRIRMTELPDDLVDMFDNGARWAANLIDPQMQR
jgi:hypothetical protein